MITDDDLGLDIILNENWQYFIETTLAACNFIETILAACKTNNRGINNTIDLKNINLIKKPIENITICKQTYLNFYNQKSKYFINNK